MLLTLLAAAPLPFAGEAAWAWPGLSAVAGTILILSGIGGFAGRASDTPSHHRIWPSAVLFTCVVMWAMVQARAILPEEMLPELWNQAARMLATPGAGTLSVDPDRTMAAVVKLLCYGGVFLLAYRVALVRANAILLMRGVVAIALAYAAYGFTVEFLGLNTVLWYPKSRDFGQLSSTFLDRNAFASYAGICLVAVTALLFRPKMRAGDMTTEFRFAVRAVLEYFLSRSLIGIVAAGILFAAVVVTHSRAGLGATALGLAVFVSAVTRNRHSRMAAVLAVLAIGAGATLILSIAGSGTLDRLSHTSQAASERGHIYRLTADAITTAPLTGTGYGTFEDIFSARRDETLLGEIAHGHNIYLENALELGIPAVSALVIAVGWLGALCLAATRDHGRDAFFPAMGAGIIVLIGAHSLFDSVLRVPALAMTFAALLGVAVARTTADPKEDAVLR